jgi:hypothetical protein
MAVLIVACTRASAQFTEPLERLNAVGVPGMYVGPLRASALVGDGVDSDFDQQFGNADSDEMLAYAAVAATAQFGNALGDCRTTGTALCPTAIEQVDTVAETDTTVTGEATIVDSSPATTSTFWTNRAIAGTLWEVQDHPSHPAAGTATLDGHFWLLGIGADPAHIGLQWPSTLESVAGASRVRAEFQGPGLGWLITGVLQQSSAQNPNAEPITIGGTGGMGGGGEMTLTDDIDVLYTFTEAVSPGPPGQGQIVGLISVIWSGFASVLDLDDPDGFEELEEGVSGGAGGVVADYLWYLKSTAWFTVVAPEPPPCP